MEQESRVAFSQGGGEGTLVAPPLPALQGEITADLLWVATAEGIVEEESLSWCAFTGQKGADLDGWNWLAAIHPDDREAIKTPWQRSPTRTGINRLVCRIRRYDGIYRTCLVRALPMLDADGGIHEWIAFGTDITEAGTASYAQDQVTAREEARGARRRPPEYSSLVAYLELLQLILDALPSSVYLVQGHDARLVLANHATTRLWQARWSAGQPMQEFLTSNDIHLLGADGRPLPFEQLATCKAIRQGRTVHQCQEFIRHRDGSILPVIVDTVALSTRDLSIPLPEGTFVEKVESAAIVVIQEVAALKEAERIKDEFISIAAHELRQPLTILKGFTQTLLLQTARGRGPALADWQKEALDEIEQATQRLDRLTADLLDVTRMQAGRLVLHREPVDLLALTRQAVAQLQMTTDRHRLSLEAPAQSPVVYADHGRIEQVLSNLLGNAIKYSPEGGSIEVTIRIDHGEKVAIVSIRDHGIGIPAQQQGRIFGRFMRADNARAAGIGGTGLGLHLSRGIIEQHQGRLWFESTAGEGSTFFLSLPLCEDTDFMFQATLPPT